MLVLAPVGVPSPPPRLYSKSRDSLEEAGSMAGGSESYLSSGSSSYIV